LSSSSHPALAHPWQGRLAELTWLAAVVLIPTTLDVRANQAFELPKLLLVSFFGVISLTLVSVGLVFVRGWVVRGRIAALALGWVLIVAVAAFRSANLAEGIWGSYERQSGLVLVIALVGVAAGPWMYLRSSSQLQRLVWAMVFGCLPVLFYGLIQRADLDWIGWIGRPLGVTSTLGASTALGGYIALVAALTMATILAQSLEQEGRARLQGRLLAVMAAAMLALELSVLLLTSVRAALAGCVLGLLVTYLIIEARRDRRLGKRGATIAMAAILIMGIGVLVLSGLRGDSSEMDQVTLPRADTSLTERLDLWRTAQRAITDAARSRPMDLLLGAGPDQQASLLEPWLEPSLPARLETTRFDRVHLSIADTTLTTGLAGLLAVSAMLILGIRQAVTSPRDLGPGATMLMAGTAGAFIAFLSESSVSFPSVTSLMLISILLGAMVGISSPSSTRRENTSASWNSTLAIFAGVLAGILLLALPSLALHLRADHAHQRAIAYAANEELREAINREREATFLDSAQMLYAAALGELLLQRAESAPRDESSRPEVLDSEPGVEQLLEEAVAALERLNDESSSGELEPAPVNPFVYALHARALDELMDARGNTAPGARDRAFEVALQAATLAPMRPALKDAAARIALLNGDAESALRLYAEAEALDPAQAQRIAEVGHVYRALGNTSEAERRYDEAIRLDDRTADAWWGKAQVQIERGSWDDALDPAMRAARYQMGDWRFHRDLGRVYRQLGDRENARQEFRTAARLSPSWKWSELRADIDALGRETN
jgi:tetratricopeptide (TPR) repeat protein